MKRIALSLFAVAVVAGVVVGRAQTLSRTEVKSAPQSAKEVRGASPYHRDHERAGAQADRGPAASRSAGSGRCLDPVAG